MGRQEPPCKMKDIFQCISFLCRACAMFSGIRKYVCIAIGLTKRNKDLKTKKFFKLNHWRIPKEMQVLKRMPTLF